QLQRQQHQCLHQSQHQQNPIRFQNLSGGNVPVQQNRAIGRNPQASYQPDQFHEEEYQPRNNVAFNPEPDETFFDLQH
ncbi:hypothetical protein A2U01_0095643, partial [Trifolium medium]|nr:hypothetical protein [Trifolium medium]